MRIKTPQMLCSIRCERCESGSEMGSHMSSLACPTCACGEGCCVPRIKEGKLDVYQCSNCSAEIEGKSPCVCKSLMCFKFVVHPAPMGK